MALVSCAHSLIYVDSWNGNALRCSGTHASDSCWLCCCLRGCFWFLSLCTRVEVNFNLRPFFPFHFARATGKLNHNLRLIACTHKIHFLSHAIALTVPSYDANESLYKVHYCRCHSITSRGNVPAVNCTMLREIYRNIFTITSPTHISHAHGARTPS